jgi:hypothetical protein
MWGLAVVEFILRDGPESKSRIDDRGHNGDKIVRGMVRVCSCAVNVDWIEDEDQELRRVQPQALSMYREP